MMIVPIWCYSQDTLKITSEQLRITNLIFLEHKKFSEQVPLLENRIYNLEQINKSWENTDSLKTLQLNNYYKVIESQNRSLEDLNKSLKIKKDIINYGGTIGIVAIVLCLIMK
jgi:hypothetical protein